MKTEQTEFAAFIGIDWADRKHDVCLQVGETGKRERFIIEHRPKVLHAWAEQLRERFGGAPVAVCVELAKGPIVSALLEHDFLVVFPVQPSLLAKYRDLGKGDRRLCRLERWPTIQAATKARKSALEAFFRDHNVRCKRPPRSVEIVAKGRSRMARLAEKFGLARG